MLVGTTVTHSSGNCVTSSIGIGKSFGRCDVTSTQDSVLRRVPFDVRRFKPSAYEGIEHLDNRPTARAVTALCLSGYRQ